MTSSASPRPSLPLHPSTAPATPYTGATPASPGGTVSRTLIDEFLADQQATTAVERFARWHEDATPRTRAYRDLVPATPPAPGQQYAFEVDLDACSGCTACVVACGNLNGLDDGRSFRSTGTLVADRETDTPVRRTVTTACHHCAEPGCLEGCPANAYEKDPVTGVVRHLDDQCIGCSYCTLTCPYDVPAFDADRGIVRKCDLCHDRLAEGEAPACVQACPTEAITIRTVDLDDVHAAADEHWPFPAPGPSTTRPTTRYRTSEDLVTGVVAVDDGAAGLAHAHLPLTVMLVLTQIAVGTSSVLLAAATWSAGPLVAAAAGPTAGTVLGTAVVALGASILHLGRPLQAWRAVLGFSHSWLSREIVAFGVFAPLAAATAAGTYGVPVLRDHVAWLAPLAALAGIVGVATSVMVYAVCGRRWWSLPRVAGRFAATTAVGGLTTVLLVTTSVGAVSGVDTLGTVRALVTASSVVGVAMFLSELGLLRHHLGASDDELARTARLLRRRLPGLVSLRLALLLVGTIGAPWLAVVMLTVQTTSATAAAVCASLAVAATLTAELLERWRFFTASAPARMPGGLR
jgi:formate dehydrogenase iron-sulfur subunit